jgi:hypothetical protein
LYYNIISPHPDGCLAPVFLGLDCPQFTCPKVALASRYSATYLVWVDTLLGSNRARIAKRRKPPNCANCEALSMLALYLIAQSLASVISVFDMELWSDSASFG